MRDQSTPKIRPRERDAILQALRAGVTPRNGLQHIQVGRNREIKAVLDDLQRLVDGGSGFRMIIGEYGSGKTFFLQLARNLALEKQLVTMHADLTPDRRLFARNGTARNLYRELINSLATKSKPEGGALSSIVERFISSAQQYAESHGLTVESVLHEQLRAIEDLAAGDFARVIVRYWEAHDDNDDEKKQNALRWLRGEFSNRNDVRNALGVRTMVEDTNIFTMLKLIGRLVRETGYRGLLINLDEMVTLYKLSNTSARNANYEQLLALLNDTLQGNSAAIGFMFGGTPEFLSDRRKGLFSYEALRSRLSENSFAAQAGVIDYRGPVLRLNNLSREELYVLLKNIRNVYAGGDNSRQLMPDDGLYAFLRHAESVIGEAYFRTPRSTIRAFVQLLDLLDQYPQLRWQEQIGSVLIEQETGDDLNELFGDDDPRDQLMFPL
jgi:hypothetical protein